MNLKSTSQKLRFWTIWLVVTTGSWGIAQYVGFNNREETLKSLSQIAPLVLALCLRGFVLGWLVSSLQWFIFFRPYKKNTGSWVLTTTSGYSIGAGLSLVVAIALGWSLAYLSGMELLTGEKSNLNMSYPLAVSMIFSGVFVAIPQWFSLRNFLPSPNIKQATLWIAGTTLAWGLAFWVAGYSYSAGLLAQNVAAGSIVGAISGANLVLLFSSAPMQSEPHATAQTN